MAQDGVVICMVTTRLPKTIVKPTALGPVANTDTKLLIYGLFQKGRVLAQDGVKKQLARPPDIKITFVDAKDVHADKSGKGEDRSPPRLQAGRG